MYYFIRPVGIVIAFCCPAHVLHESSSYLKFIVSTPLYRKTVSALHRQCDHDRSQTMLKASENKNCFKLSLEMTFCGWIRAGGSTQPHNCLSNAIPCMGQNIKSLCGVCLSVCAHGILGSNISKRAADRGLVTMEHE